MKKITLAALILGAFATSAQAQSNVTIYGIVDAGIVHESGGKDGNVTRLGSGIASASRFGFRGNEDLGNGLSAVFTLEVQSRSIPAPAEREFLTARLSSA